MPRSVCFVDSHALPAHAVGVEGCGFRRSQVAEYGNPGLQRCLAKDRGKRFASVAAMQQDLIPAIEHCPPLSPAVTTSDAPVSEEATTGLLPA